MLNQEEKSVSDLWSCFMGLQGKTKKRKQGQRQHLGNKYLGNRRRANRKESGKKCVEKYGVG